MDEADGLNFSQFAFSDESFESASEGRGRRLYGVDYIYLNDPALGEMHVTQEGWPHREWLQPYRWHTSHLFASIGERLVGGTGSVYRVPVQREEGLRELVVKFSRFAQEIPPFAPDSTFPPGTPLEAIYSARFNNPFEEFGLLREVRLGRYGPKELHILTKRPLAIFSPSQEYPGWRLGRDGSLVERHQQDLAVAQPEPGMEQTQLNERRVYILLFQWVKGEDVRTLYRRGEVTFDALLHLTDRVNSDLQAKGFRVLDHKPEHIILRPRRDGSLLYRHGEPAYALVDFELLQRTEEYARQMLAAFG